MIVAPTKKLYFNRFVHCIKFKIQEHTMCSPRHNSTIKAIKSFLKSDSTLHRSRIDWYFTAGKSSVNITLSIYLNDDAVYGKLLNTYNNIIYWTSKPLNDNHKADLLRKIEIEFREKLLYDRFKYKLYIKLGWKREHLNEINEWIANQFENRINGRKGDYFLTGSWALCLYLKHESDLTMIRLSLGEHITSVIKVELLSNYPEIALPSA